MLLIDIVPKKKKKCQYDCEHYKILPEDEKQRLVEFRKIILESK